MIRYCLKIICQRGGIFPQDTSRCYEMSLKQVFATLMRGEGWRGNHEFQDACGHCRSSSLESGAVMELVKWSILLIAIISATSGQDEYEVPEATLEALRPRGFRVSIPGLFPVVYPLMKLQGH